MDYIAALGEALLTAAPDEKIRIAEALKELEDSRAEPYLLEALDQPDNEVRKAVAYALSFVATPRSERRLIQLLDDPHFVLRTWAAYGLAHLRSRAAVPKLIDALGDEDESVVAAAVHALGEVGDTDAVGPLVELLQGREHVRGILQSLGAIGCPDAAGVIAGYLDDCDPDVRCFALIAMRSFPDSVPSAKLEKLLKEERGVNRAMANRLMC
ncbi:MAG TPA: HEAT repeat domain-containing protein, partial [Candidatus Bathyarchaeia archaeon]